MSYKNDSILIVGGLPSIDEKNPAGAKSQKYQTHVAVGVCG